LASFERHTEPDDAQQFREITEAEAARRPSNTANADAYQMDLEAIDLEISKMVAEEPTAWSFAELQTRAETAVARAQTAIERGRARLLLAKIVRFEDLRQRYQTIANVQSQTDRINANLAMQAPETMVPAAAQVDISPRRGELERFDGVGRLMAVQSPRVGQPQFALIDAAGQFRTYLSPAPGVILRPYVGQQVGVSGSRGFMPQLNAQHLTAKRITVLEAPLVR
jgi:hypothetical protein